MVLTFERAWIVGGHLTVVLPHEYVAVLGVVWVDQLCRGQPVYLTVIEPAAESKETEIMDDLEKSTALLGQVDAVFMMTGGGWLRDGTAPQ